MRPQASASRTSAPGLPQSPLILLGALYFEQSARALALRHLRVALQALDDERASIQARKGADETLLSLYRQEDPGAVLTKVIARELEDWPRSDPRWLGRFSDLQSAVRERVGAG